MIFKGILLIILLIVMRYYYMKISNCGVIFNRKKSIKLNVGGIYEMWIRNIENFGVNKSDWFYSGKMQVVEIEPLEIKKIEIVNNSRCDLIEFKLI